MRNGDHLHAELGGALRQGTQHALAVALLLVVLTLIGVLLALGQHRVDQPRQLVGCGGDGLGLSMREHILRKYAPRADLLLRSAAAARRRACAARLTTRAVLPLMTLPPVILVPGHRPSQDAKC